MKSLGSHHVAWLGAHPQRSEGWLREMLRDGFDVHHIDGNHGNDAVENLVLIESGDHMMMHCGVRIYRVNGKGGGRPKKVRVAPVPAAQTPVVPVEAAPVVDVVPAPVARRVDGVSLRMRMVMDEIEAEYSIPRW